MRSSVDFPAPLGPTTPSTSPGATVTETPARITAAPCALCRSRAIRVPATRISVRSAKAMLALTIALVLSLAHTSAAAPPHDGYQATCARQSGAAFPRGFTSRENLVVGPLAMVGGRRSTPADAV